MGKYTIEEKSSSELCLDLDNQRLFEANPSPKNEKEAYGQLLKSYKVRQLAKIY